MSEDTMKTAVTEEFVPGETTALISYLEDGANKPTLF
jgi:hypothetical protein